MEKFQNLVGVMWENIYSRCAGTTASATREKLPQEDDPYWAYQYSDGSFWTDDIFSTKEQGERFAKGPDADLVEGATLVEVVLRRTDGTGEKNG